MAEKFTIGDGGITNSGFKFAPDRGMDEEEYGVQVLAMQSDAVEYIDGFVAMDRAQAQGFYLGDKFGNEEDGRSQIVMTISRDVILSIVPEILRIFTASGKLGEFVPNSARTVEQAAQSTDYCNHIIWYDNNGFLVLHNAFKDALTVKTGIIKWRWSDDTEIMEADYTDLELEELLKLEHEPDTEILKADPVEKEAAADDGMGNITPAVVVYDVRIRRKKQKQRVIIEAVPPEEFIVHRETRDLDSSPYVGHRCLKTKSDLIAMGYDREDIDTLTASDDSLYMTNIEAQTRNPAINLFSNDTGSNDAAKRVLYVEQFIRIDKDGDGIAELRKVCSVGNHILHDEVADGVHFADLCPDPTPHMFIGQSIADQTMDLQLIISAIVRDVLDSLKQSINPRTWMVEGQVNADDMLNNEVGGVIRMRQPGMAGEFTTTFVGQQALPVLAYMDGIKQRRTGITDASQGLDPDVLQSTTEKAVQATVQGAQARIEMIARLFAEGGIKRLMKGILKMVIRHQDKPRILRLRDKFVTMDPRFWDSELDIQPNVALGRGTDQDKLKFLILLVQQQEKIIQTLGVGNPLVPIDKYRETLAQICHLAGFKDETKFFGEIDPKQFAEQMKQQAQNKPQDPTAMLAEIEKAKVQASVAKNQAEAQQKQQEMMLTHQREMEKMRLDAAVKLAVAEMTATGTFNSSLIEQLISHDIAISQGHIQAGTDKHAAEVGGLAEVAGAHIAANAPQQVQ